MRSTPSAGGGPGRRDSRLALGAGVRSVHVTSTRPHGLLYRWRILPASATPDAERLLAARALRGFADGFVSVLLASYLTDIGYSPVQVGAIVTGTLLSSAALTLAVGLLGHRLNRRRL